MKTTTNLIIHAALVLSAMTAFSDGEAEGGMLLKRGSYQGRIAIVNQQKRIPEADIKAATEVFANCTKCNVAVTPDAKGAAVTLTVIDDPKEPSVLIAPEDHWGKLNVAKLVDDLPGEGAKKKFLVPRARKMVIKTLSLLCGGGSSTFRGNLMNTATMRELDMLEEQIPVDMYDKYTNYLRQLGVTKKETVSYLEACVEGWAPAPTNDVQKEIWKEVKNPATRWDKDFGGKKK